VSNGKKKKRKRENEIWGFFILTFSEKNEFF